MKKGIIIAVIALAVIGGGIWLFLQDAQNPQATNPFANKTSRELALMCEPTEHLVMHIHPVMTIMVNGEKQEVPPNIGIEGVGGNSVDHTQAQTQASCLHFLHTHDNTGTLHVESPVPMDYRLSDFFAVWDKTFTPEQILDFKASDTHRVKMTVNGQESTEYGDLILRDKDQIVISYEAK